MISWLYLLELTEKASQIVSFKHLDQTDKESIYLWEIQKLGEP